MVLREGVITVEDEALTGGRYYILRHISACMNERGWAGESMAFVQINNAHTGRIGVSVTLARWCLSHVMEASPVVIFHGM